ncbi:MAG: hypothetical protein ACYC23_20430 [Limisphaerales bacterium]
MGSLKYTDVFVPGGFPRHTYNPRLGLKLETTVRQVTENLCKLVPVTGHTKSGKTVLVRSILPREDAVWVDGGGAGSEDDFWTTVIDQLNLFQSSEVAEEKENAAEFSASGTIGANFLVAKGEAEVGGTYSTARRATTTRSRSVSPRVAALGGLRAARRALVIDDFHYLPKDLQGELIRALKPLVFDGLPVVIIAIPHRRYDAVKVEKEMTGRILPVGIPTWSVEELQFIPSTGFPLLAGSLSDRQAQRLAEESIGSPHLMQEFCRAICKTHGITTTFGGKAADVADGPLEAVFAETADTIGRPIFEKLARGPRQRSDRIARKLKTGQEVDIYGLVLHALASRRPGLITLEYEDLRSAIRDITAQDPPQLHEVARVLKHMSDIAATDQSSTPVLDFDEEDKRLHITDPFFAFYLRWGNLDG